MEQKSSKAPCREACPAGVDVPRYLRFIAAGKYAEALAVIRESIPFPAVCGYVCPAPCELKCQLAAAADAPEAIRTLKRFAADQAAQGPLAERPTPPAGGKPVAIVGAGPAGLTAAYYLARAGHKPTVFEALPEAGGMMRVGIPAYRLPRNVLDSDIATIETAGVEIKTGVRIESAAELLAKGYAAVFVALGAHRGARMGIAGEEGPGVVDALSFLAAVNRGRNPQVADRVAVVGGGNSAVDAARTCLRLGAKEVTILYRRTREEMRAYPSEVEEAVREGVRLELLAVPNRIVAANGNLRVECLRAAAGRKDASGLPVSVAGSGFDLEVQMVIAAVGQEPAIPAGFGLPLAGRTIRVGPDGTTTAKAGVFAGADCVTGPRSVIEAIAGGRQAAAAIDRYLGGSGLIEERLAPAEAPLPPPELPPEGIYPLPTAGPNPVPLLSVAERFNGFAAVELALSPETAVAEAKRCLRCDLPISVEAAKCRTCYVCQLVCSLRFEGAFDTAKAALRIVPAVAAGGETRIDITFEEKCDGCGLCARYCPFGALSRGCAGT
ncbi:MAG: FAD-dependent oxidoreductase [Syntrophales bacterium]